MLISDSDQQNSRHSTASAATFRNRGSSSSIRILRSAGFHIGASSHRGKASIYSTLLPGSSTEPSLKTTAADSSKAQQHCGLSMESRPNLGVAGRSAGGYLHPALPCLLDTEKRQSAENTPGRHESERAYLAFNVQDCCSCITYSPRRKKPSYFTRMHAATAV